eukprot:TRINITY_DN14602_c0_g1_i1.p1 TRINITY_DN14602_c0_g1~~TRINITY_DN14602_c0_g1_i1.p1  ORF type:complete len:518 (+),score=167.58 TRINITY_DN14602_c0_g1_i1:70-1623(+)
MEAFRPLRTKVSAAGRPAFCRGEAELLLQDGVGFYDREARSSYESGTLYLTTHRLVWVEAGKADRAIYIPLGDVRPQVTSWPGVWVGVGWSHPKLTLKLASGEGRYFKLSFRKYGQDTFRSKLQTALKAQAWVHHSISNYDVLEEKARPTAVTLAAADARLVGGAERSAAAGVANLDAPGSKGIWSFECAVAGPYDVTVQFAPSQAATALSIYVNGSPSPYKLALAANVTAHSGVLTFERGANTLYVAQQTFPRTPTPAGVLQFTLTPLSKAQRSGGTGAGPALGVGGLVRKIEHRDAQDASTLNSAFTDIDALMEVASDVTVLLKQLEESVVKDSLKKGGDQSEVAAQEKDLNDWMASLGLCSIVTKESVGMGDYHLEVAKQLLEFLQAPLQRQRGMLSVVDAYCLYNKARGVDLVSPGDMMKACQKLAALPGSNIRMTEVNGVQLLKLDDLAGDRMLLGLLADASAFVTPLALASHLSLPARVCSEILSDALQRGVLCIDAQHPQGAVFYRNLFE